jgi:preprotein translocase subunit SecF
MIRLLYNKSYDFVKYWRHAAIITAVFIVVGFGALLARGGFNYNIEFTGGTFVQVSFPSEPGIEAVRQTIEAAGFRGAQVARFGSATEYSVRVQEAISAEGGSQADIISRRLQTALEQRFGSAPAPNIVRAEYVVPQVGSELKQKATTAILLSFLVTLVYLGFRFEWRFGVTAIIATAHDIVATLAFIGLLNLEVSLTVVAAILTVIGYSLNDTIIIFDRVRENIRKQRKETLTQVLNRSINETLPRSVLTHATTLAATVALLIFAGEIIRPFSWVMAFGVFTGTFSSLYVAPAVLLFIERRWPRPTSTDPRVPSRQGAAAPQSARARPAGAGAR